MPLPACRAPPNTHPLPTTSSLPSQVAELLRAGADTGVADLDGRTPTQLATNEIVLAMLADRQKAFTF